MGTRPHATRDRPPSPIIVAFGLLAYLAVAAVMALVLWLGLVLLLAGAA